MSEFPRSARVGAGIVAGVLAAGLASGCTAEAVPRSLATEAPQATALAGDMKLCYAEPPTAKLPRVEAKDYTDAVTASNVTPITIHQNPGKAARNYNAHMPEKITKKVGAATVKIIRGKFTGSGFVVLDPNGEPVVVTAAHVVAPDNVAKKSELKIIDAEGNTTTVESGCYANGSYGVDSPPGDHSPEQVDLAILRPSNKVGQAALTLAAQPPKRGERVGFYNFQQDRDITYPASYTGIALDMRTESMDNTILTGLGAEDDEIIDNAVEGGASGSAGIDPETGDVYGVIVSKRSVDYRDMSPFGVTYTQPSAADWGTATIGSMTDAADLQYALAGGNY
jgi:hypothetical protein